MWQPISQANALRRLPSGGSRTISTMVLSTRVPLAPLQDQHIDRWCTAMSPLTLEPGDIANVGTVDADFCPAEHVEALHACMQAWKISPGTEAPVTLVCRGAGFHNDADSYAGQGFCVLWLSEDAGWDLVFPLTGNRVALDYGTVVLFDSALAHGVLRRDADQYDANDFVDASAGLFLSQDFPLHAAARQRMGITKYSRRGVGNRTILGADGVQEDVDLETGRWSARAIGRRT
jgi:hypothetical protein